MRRDGAANRERILVAAEQVFGAGGAGASTEEVGRVLRRAQAAGAAGADGTVDDVFTLARALAHVAWPDDAATERAMEIVLDGLGVRR